MSNYDGAHRELEKALAAEPNNSEYLSHMGMVWMARREMDSAIHYFERSYELDPHSINQGLWAAGACVKDRRWDEAEMWADRYIANRPEHKYGYFRKADVYLYGRGDLNKARSILEEGLNHVRNPSDLTAMRWLVEYCSRDYERALNVLQSDTSRHYLAMGYTYRLMRESENAMACFDSARARLEILAEVRPDDSEHYSDLGLAYAALGMKDEAIRAGEKGSEMTPIKSTLLSEGEDRLRDLALIRTELGDSDEAIKQLETLLSIPGYLTRWGLRLDPRYDPLRDHPRFKKLVGTLE